MTRIINTSKTRIINTSRQAPLGTHHGLPPQGVHHLRRRTVLSSEGQVAERTVPARGGLMLRARDDNQGLLD